MHSVHASQEVPGYASVMDNPQILTQQISLFRIQAACPILITSFSIHARTMKKEWGRSHITFNNLTQK